MLIIKIVAAVIALPFTICIDALIFLCKCIVSIFISAKEKYLYSETEYKKRKLNRIEKHSDEFFNLTASAWKSIFK